MEEGFDEAFSSGPEDRAATAPANCGVTYSRKETHNTAFLRVESQSYSQDVTDSRTSQEHLAGELRVSLFFARLS